MPLFLKSKLAFKNYIIICMLLVLVKLSDPIPINITLDNLVQNYTEPSFFRISPNPENETNYIKVEIKGKNPEQNYIISYYKEDSTFNKRDQLAQSLSGKAFMWLNKNQIKKDFYLSVECPDSNCEFTFNISLKEDIQLEVLESYTYTVTEDNKETTFIFNSGVVNRNFYHCILSIWAKGSKTIDTQLNAKEYTKHPDFNAYLINMGTVNKEFNYTFVVKGSVGDTIHVGSLFFSEYNIYINYIANLGMELPVFLAKGILDDADFIFPKSSSNLTHTLYQINYDYQVSEFLKTGVKFFKNDNEIFFRLDPYENFSFYSLQYIENGNSSHSKKFNHYPPQELGVTYQRNLIKEEIIGLIPMKPQSDFTYLTYHVAVKEGKYKAFIYECEKYPFCDIESVDLKQLKQLIDFNSASISFSNKEYDNNISPISKKQKMLLLKCETESCKLLTTMYTDKDQLNIFLSVPYYKYIRENSAENYLLSIKKEIVNSFSVSQKDVYIYINLEILSGKITLTSKGNKEIKKKKGKKLYIVDINKLKDFSLKVEANKNSAFSISASIHTDEIDLLTPQSNYLLKYNDNSNGNMLLFTDEKTVADKPYYFGFYSLGCNLEVKNSVSSTIKNGENFSQDCQNIDNNIKSIQYKANIVEDKKNCLFGVSMYKLYDEKNSLNSILLPNDAQYPFLFTDNYKTVKYMQINGDKDKDLILDINVNENSTYNITLLLNDQEKYNYDISANEQIRINSSEIKDVCKDDTQPCKIDFIINAIEINEKSSIEIIANKGEYDDEDKEEERKEEKKEEKGEEESENDHTLLYIMLGVLGGIIILVLIIMFFVIKNKRKKSGGNFDENNFKEQTDEMALLDSKA